MNYESNTYRNERPESVKLNDEHEKLLPKHKTQVRGWHEMRVAGL